jgi:hypothetical protein
MKFLKSLNDALFGSAPFAPDNEAIMREQQTAWARRRNSSLESFTMLDYEPKPPREATLTEILAALIRIEEQLQRIHKRM